ncbi:MAG: cadmium-translocating P-type ATPase [Bacilli bacterium]|nr:cadmium-translocating P-type ATPase [Bacilli bacterium]
MACHEHKHEHKHEHQHCHHEHEDHECACGATHYQEENNTSVIIRVVLSFISLLVMFFVRKYTDLVNEWLTRAIYIIIYIMISYDVIYEMILGFKKKDIFNERTLMIVASLGTFGIDEFFEGIMVITLYQLGEFLEDLSVERSKKTIMKAMDLRPKIAHRIIDSDILDVNPEDINIGDHLLIKVGEAIPLDGIIEEGHGTLNTAALTGESLPLDAEVGDSLLAGYILTSGSIKIKVTKEYKNSAISKIIDLITTNTDKKSKNEKFVDKFARYYTPIVFACALLILFIPSLITGEWAIYIKKALTFLVISCPCSIVISVPLTYFTGMGLAAKNGVIFKGATYLEQFDKLQKIYFDKTGTITNGQFEIEYITLKKIKDYDIQQLVKEVESFSTHPIARSIVGSDLSNLNTKQYSNVQELSGYGIVCEKEKDRIIVGNGKLLDKYKVKYDKNEVNGSFIYVVVNSDCIGLVVLKDQIKKDTRDVINYLNNKHVKTCILTGDKEYAAKEIASNLGISEYHAELLPEDKVNCIKNDNIKTIGFIGDGINDAPCIALADIGISLGEIGSDISVETADVVLMNDTLKGLKIGKKVSHYTNVRALICLIFALTVKGFIFVYTIFKEASLWLAMFADVGVTLLLVLYALLLIYKKVNK